MNDKEIEQQAKKALDQSTRELSPRIRQSLYEARQVALSRQHKPRLTRPLVGFAIAASFSAILLVNYLPQDPTQQEQLLSEVTSDTNNSREFDDFIFLASFDDTDIVIAEDLEFAYWISEQLENDSNIENLSNDELHNG